MLTTRLLIESFLFSLVLCLPREGIKNTKGIVSQEVDDDEEKGEEKKKELVNMLNNNVLRRVADDDTGKVIPGEVIPGAIRVPHLPAKDKNFARRMAEAQWHQQHSKLHPKPFPEYKQVMHNRNTINDNRHDRKSKKIPRHPH